jgi:hypothetical protein
VARCWAGFASFGAGLVHIAVVPEQMSVSWTQGAFSTVVGLAQIAWGVWALARATVPFPRATAAATLGLISLWAVTRTVGLSLDPLSAVPQPVGTTDLLGVVLEIGLLLCILVAMQAPAPVPAAASPDPLDDLDLDRPGGARQTGRTLALLAAGALAVSAIATPAMAASESGQNASQHH